MAKLIGPQPQLPAPKTEEPSAPAVVPNEEKDNNMEHSIPVLPASYPIGNGYGYNRDGRETLKDVLHASCVANLNGQRELESAIRQEGQDAVRETAQASAANERAHCATDEKVLSTRYDLGKSILENRFEVERAVKDLESRSTERLLDVRRELADKLCAADVRREILAKEDVVRQLELAKEAALRQQECCCEIKRTVETEGQRTRDFLQQQEIDRLRSELSAAKAAR